MAQTIEHVQKRSGEYYIASTRIPVGVVIASWKRQTAPERIVEQFPMLSLADVYGAITYYLDHQQELEQHFALLHDEYERERLRARDERPEFFSNLKQRIDAWRAEHPSQSDEQDT